MFRTYAAKIQVRSFKKYYFFPMAISTKVDEVSLCTWAWVREKNGVKTGIESD